MFVGGLPESVTEDDLYNYFTRFGEVESTIINREHFTNRSRGCGFVIFTSKKSAKKTIYYKKPNMLHGKQFGCKACKLRNEVAPKFQPSLQEYSNAQKYHKNDQLDYN